MSAAPFLDPSRCLCTSYPFLGGLGETKDLRKSCSHRFVKIQLRPPSPTHFHARLRGMLTCRKQMQCQYLIMTGRVCASHTLKVRGYLTSQVSGHCQDALNCVHAVRAMTGKPVQTAHMQHVLRRSGIEHLSEDPKDALHGHL